MNTAARGDATIALRLDGVGRSYGRGKHAVQALGAVSEVFPVGTFTAIMGPSGSGKSTLIQCAAGLDKPSRGTVVLGDVELSRLKEPKLTATRRRQLGFIFQAFNLLPTLTVRQNIELPVRLDGRAVDQAWLDTLLNQVGLASHERRVPSELSGGQQQRVAIARALIARPQVVFADEPTGALDTTSARAVLELMRSTVDSLGQTMIMVTHDPVAASYADRVLFLANGAVVDRLQRSSASAIAQRLTALEDV
ncbi:MAG: ABC transporter ATP-binding protein [Thermomicrobiales bacterium]